MHNQLSLVHSSKAWNTDLCLLVCYLFVSLSLLITFSRKSVSLFSFFVCERLPWLSIVHLILLQQWLLLAKVLESSSLGILILIVLHCKLLLHHELLLCIEVVSITRRLVLC